jgi:hypothetical protein
MSHAYNGNLAFFDYVVAPVAGRGYGDYFTLEAAANGLVSDEEPGIVMGDDTTQWNVVTLGATTSYTYAATGTDPGIEPVNVKVGDKVSVRVPLFNAGNNGIFVVTSSASGTVTLANPNGSDQGPLATGATGSVNLGKSFYVRSGKYTLASDFLLLGGCEWVFQDCHMVTGASDSFMGFMANQTDIKLSGCLEISGSGDSGNSYASIFSEAGGSDIDGSQLLIKISTDLDEGGTGVGPVRLFGSRVAFNFKAHDLDYSTSTGAQLIYSEAPNSRICVDIDTIASNTAGTIYGLRTGPGSITSTFDVNIDAITNAGAGDGIGVFLGGGTDETVRGVSKNCKTNYTDTGTRTNDAGLNFSV